MIFYSKKKPSGKMTFPEGFLVTGTAIETASFKIKLKND